MQPFRITPSAWIRMSILLALMTLTCAAYSAYKGHADDRDVNAVVAAYPNLKNAAAEYRFNENYDHNGGRSSLAIIAIRVNPLPRGTRDYQWQKARDQLVAEGKLVIFGALKGRNREKRLFAEQEETGP